MAIIVPISAMMDVRSKPRVASLQAETVFRHIVGAVVLIRTKRVIQNHAPQQSLTFPKFSPGFCMSSVSLSERGARAAFLQFADQLPPCWLVITRHSLPLRLAQLTE